MTTVLLQQFLKAGTLEKILNTPRNKSANLTQFAKLILPHSSRLEAFSLPAQIIGQFSPAEHSFDLLKKVEFFEHNRTPLNAYSRRNSFASAPQLCVFDLRVF